MYLSYFSRQDHNAHFQMSQMLLVISVNARNECALEEIPHQKLVIIKSTKLFYNCLYFFFNILIRYFVLQNMEIHCRLPKYKYSDSNSLRIPLPSAHLTILRPEKCQIAPDLIFVNSGQRSRLQPNSWRIPIQFQSRSDKIEEFLEETASAMIYIIQKKFNSIKLSLRKR